MCIHLKKKTKKVESDIELKKAIEWKANKQLHNGFNKPLFCANKHQ